MSETNIRLLCSKARDLFLEESNVTEAKAPIHIFGDIHGQFLDLLRHFDKLGYPDATENSYMFLGDYVDRFVLILDIYYF